MLKDTGIAGIVVNSPANRLGEVTPELYEQKFPKLALRLATLAQLIAYLEGKRHPVVLHVPKITGSGKNNQCDYHNAIRAFSSSQQR